MDFYQSSAVLLIASFFHHFSGLCNIRSWYAINVWLVNAVEYSETRLGAHPVVDCCHLIVRKWVNRFAEHHNYCSVAVLVHYGTDGNRVD